MLLVDFEVFSLGPSAASQVLRCFMWGVLVDWQQFVFLLRCYTTAFALRLLRHQPLKLLC